MATPEGGNIYDQQGTVLYRVVSAAQYERELCSGGSGRSSPAADTHRVDANTAAPGPCSVTARYGPQADLTVLSLPKKFPARLAPLEGALLQSSTQHGITPEQALEKIMPARPFATDDHAEGRTGRSFAADDTARSGTAGSVRRPETASSVRREKREMATRGTSPSTPAATREETYVKAASTYRCSRLDVILLLQHLQRRAAAAHARPRGVLCSVREGVFDDGLTELTRQITLLCPERGLLMDELRKGMAQANETYDVLFDNACQYAVRKSMERDLCSHLFQEKKQLESEVRRLDNRVNELRAKHDGMMKHFEEQRVATQEMHEEEIAYIKKANQQIVSEIKRLAALESANSGPGGGGKGIHP